MTPALTTQYHPVKKFSSLLEYALRTSQWHIFTFRENRESMGARHFAPAAFLVLLLLLVPAAFMNHIALALLCGILGVYVCGGFYLAIRTKNVDKNYVIFVQPFATFCFHLAYGTGTLVGIRHLFRVPSTTSTLPDTPIHQ